MINWGLEGNELTIEGLKYKIVDVEFENGKMLLVWECIETGERRKIEVDYPVMFED